MSYMNLFEFFFDSDYYVQNLPQGVLPVGDYDPLEHYKTYSLNTCLPPNEFFANHTNLLYENIPNLEEEKKCIIEELLDNNITEEELLLLSENYDFESGEDERIKNKIEYFAQNSPDELIYLLGKDREISEIVAGYLLENKNYLPSNEILQYYSKALEKKAFPSFYKQSLSLLAKSIEHGAFLDSDSISKLEEKFIKGGCRGYTDKAMLFLAISARENLYDTSLASINIFLNHAKINPILSTEAIFATLESLIDQNKIEIEKIHEILKDISVNFPPSFISKIISMYSEKRSDLSSEDSTFYLNILSQILESNAFILQELLQKILDPLTLTINLGKGNVELYKNLVFIFNKIYQRHVTFSDDNLVQISKLLHTDDVKLQMLSANLLDKLCSQHVCADVIQNKIKEIQAIEENISTEVDFNLLKERLNTLDLIPSVKESVQDRLQHLAEIGWSQQKILDMFNAINIALKAENSKGTIPMNFDSAVKRIYNYGISPKLLNRYGDTVLDIFINSDPQDWSDSVRVFFDYNNFVVAKNAKTFLNEMKSLNANDPKIEELTSYIEQHLKGLKDRENYKEIVVKYGNEPTFLEHGKLYIYKKNDSLFYKLLSKFGVENKELNITDDIEIKKLKSFLDEKDYRKSPEELENSIYRHTGYSKEWTDSEILKWRQTIIEVNDHNIQEVLSVLNYVMHKTVFKAKYFVRDAQNAAVLSLFKGGGGRVAQVATGEGKSEIIAMFAAISVLNGRHVDIMTTSEILAMREVEDRQELVDFYSALGISVAHNVRGGVGAKECYKADVVYGYPLSFIGDALHDIFLQKKFGRGESILLVDEKDNLFIDQLGMKIQLSSTMPGSESLYQIYLYAVEYMNFLLGHSNSTDTGYTLTLPVQNNDTIDFVTKEFNGSYVEFLSDQVRVYIDDALLNKGSDEKEFFVPVLKYLQEFSKDHSGHWVESLIDSIFYKKADMHYKVHPSNRGAHKNTIAPVDYENTGAIQLGMRWSDALYQFLQIKHELMLEPENLISTFMSYPGYFLKYKGNIYGVTGTIGSNEDKYFLANTYDVDFVLIPQFIDKRFTQFPSLIAENIHEWVSSIMNVVVDIAITDERAMLIIVNTISEVNFLSEKLKKEVPYIKVYQYGNSDDQSAIKKMIQPGDVIVATNLAGRGTDIKLSSTVNKNGGLHVLMTYLPSNERVQAQGFGRAARKDELGSGQLLINLNLYSEAVEKCDSDYIKCLYDSRTDAQTEVMKDAQLCQIPKILFRDTLFRKYVSLARFASSPIGYIFQLTYDKAPEKVTEGDLYLFSEKGQVNIQALIKEKKYTLDITETLRMLDESSLNNILNLLANPEGKSLLSYTDNELINFIAAINGYSLDHKVMSRVVLAYESLWPKLSFEEKTTLSSGRIFSSAKLFDLAETKYLKSILDIDEDENSISDSMLNEAKARELYRLWIEDRALYHKEQELNQMKEKFAMWLRINGTNEEDCQYSNNTEVVLKKFEEKALLSFEEFQNKTIDEIRNNKLMVNPAYLVWQSYEFQSISFDQDQNKIDHRGKTEAKGQYDFIGKDEPVYSTYESQSNWLSASFSFFRDLMWKAFSPSIDHTVYPNDPMQDGINALNRSLEVEPQYTWITHHAMALIRLIKDGKGVTNVDQAQDAYNIKSQFISDSMESKNNLESFIIPLQQAILSHMLLANITNNTSDLARQIAVTIAMLQKLLSHIEKNINTTANTSDKQMIRIGKYLEIEELIPKDEELQSNKTNTSINIPPIEENYGGARVPEASARTNSFKITDAINQEDYRASEYAQVLDTLSASGVLLYNLEVFDLEEDDDVWFSVICVAVIGLVAIAGGVGLLGAGGVFTNALGFSLLTMGIGDLITASLSALNGEGIDMDAFIKAKGLEMAVSIIVSSLTFGLDKLGMIALKGEAIVGKTLTDKMMISVGVNLLTRGLSVIGSEIYESNDGKIEAEIREEVNRILTEYYDDLKIIFASGGEGRNNALYSEVITGAKSIIQKYAEKYHGDKSKVVRGSAVGALGLFGAGKGIAGLGVGAIIGSVINIGLGLDKAGGAVDYFSDRFTILLETKKEKALRKLMLDSVGRENSGLVDALEKAGFMKEELSLSTCDGIAGYNLGEYSAWRDIAIDSCAKVVSKVDSSDNERVLQMRDSLGSSLYQMLDNSMESMVGGGVVNHIAGIVTSGAVNKLSKILEEHRFGVGGMTPIPDGFFPEEGGMTPVPDDFYPKSTTTDNSANMGAGSGEGAAPHPNVDTQGVPANDNAASRSNKIEDHGASFAAKNAHAAYLKTKEDIAKHYDKRNMPVRIEKRFSQENGLNGNIVTHSNGQRVVNVAGWEPITDSFGGFFRDSDDIFGFGTIAVGGPIAGEFVNRITKMFSPASGVGTAGIAFPDYDALNGKSNPIQWDQIHDQVHTLINELDVYNRETGNTKPFKIYAHSLGKATSVGAALLRPDLVATIDAVDGPGCESYARNILRNNPELLENNPKALEDVFMSKLTVFNNKRNIVNWVDRDLEGTKTYTIAFDGHSIVGTEQFAEKYGSKLSDSRYYSKGEKWLESSGNYYKEIDPSDLSKYWWVDKRSGMKLLDVNTGAYKVGDNYHIHANLLTNKESVSRKFGVPIERVEQRWDTEGFVQEFIIKKEKGD